MWNWGRRSAAPRGIVTADRGKQQWANQLPFESIKIPSSAKDYDGIAFYFLFCTPP
jgi:hypothetical protein